MKKILIAFLCLGFGSMAMAQPTIYPAAENTGLILIRNGTIHTAKGQVIENGSILINNKKIEKVNTNIPAPASAKIIDAKGMHVYPGLISPITNLGIREINSGAPGFDDYSELGELNASVRSIVAYNTDSRIINILRSTGILLAAVIPQNEGGSTQLISGTSSVVKTDGWNYEDAAYKMDGQMHVNIPSLMTRRGRFSSTTDTDVTARALQEVEKLKSFFRRAQAYLNGGKPKETNLNYEATRNLFNKKQKLFAHANGVKEMLIVVDFAREFGFDVVIVGGADSWQIAPLLKESSIAVILSQPHSLPAAHDDDIDQPFKTPAMLQNAGVLFALSDIDRTTRGRNLKYNAGTAIAYGLPAEDALKAITLNTAQILGIADKTGSLEAGKDANIVISEGDIFDMGTSKVKYAFIEGAQIELDDHQKQFAERYEQKYNIEKSR